MATYAVAVAERNRLMGFAPGVSAAIREVVGGYELWARDARQTHAKAVPLDEKWRATTVGETQGLLSGVGVSVVGSSQATTPPTETAFNTGDTVVIPQPPGLEAGDLVYGIVPFAGSVLVTADEAWDEEFMLGAALVVRKVATASEPAAYTFRDGNDRSRSGCLVAVRGGSQAVSALGPGGYAFGSMENAAAGSVFVGLAYSRQDSPLLERFEDDGDSNLVVVQHIAHGGGFETASMTCAIYVETGLPIGTISGRTAVNPNGSADKRATAAIVSP